MRNIIFFLTALYLSGCAGNGAPISKSERARQAADSAMRRVYTDAAKPPVTVQVEVPPAR